MKSHPKEGFTLVEMLVYIGIFVMVSALIINFVFSIAGSWGHGRALRDVTQGGRLIMERLSHELRLASSVNIGASILDTSPGRLVLNTFDTATSSTQSTLDVSLSGTELGIQRGAASPTTLSGGAVRVTHLTFTDLKAASTSEAVWVSLTVESGSGRFIKQKTFEALVVLRGSY